MKACIPIVSVLLVTAPAYAADKPATQPPAHQHGTARLQVSLEGATLQIAFEGPADNILGFEHAPKTDAQKAAVARAEQQLRQTSELFTTTPGANCQPQLARVETKLPAGGSRETHSEIEAEWRWICANPAALAYIDVALFKAFPRLRQLRAQVVTARGQTSAVLGPKTTRIKIGS